MATRDECMRNHPSRGVGIETQPAEDLRRDKWNLQFQKASEEGDTTQVYLQVSVRYHGGDEVVELDGEPQSKFNIFSMENESIDDEEVGKDGTK